MPTSAVHRRWSSSRSNENKTAGITGCRPLLQFAACYFFFAVGIGFTFSSAALALMKPWLA